MYLFSTNDPLLKSDGNVPVSIFCYNDEKKFLRVSESYEEVIERVAKSFRIPNRQSDNIVLQTSHLTACRGRNIVIDSSAYPLLWSVVEEVEVVVLEVAPDVDGQDIHEPDGIYQTPKIKPKGKAGPSQEADWVERRPQDVASEDDSQTEVGEVIAQTIPKSSDPLFQFDDDNDGDGVQENEREEEQRAERSITFSPKKFKPSSITSPVKADVASTIKQEKQPQVDVDTTFKPVKQSTTTSSVTIKKETRSAADDENENPRFDVIIIGPDEDHTAQFKLRGKNSVRKVLGAACKNFDLDPHRAVLIHSVDMEVDGELETHEFVCSPEDTMAMCGIKHGSRLFVKVAPLNEHDQDEYSSD